MGAMGNKHNSLKINAVMNSSYRLLNAVFPVISSAYASHIIYAEGIGKVASAQNTVQYFVLGAALGISDYGVREMAKIGSYYEIQRDRLFSELFVLKTISTLFCCFAYYFMIALIPVFTNEKMLYYVSGFSILMNILNVDWVYQGDEQYQKILWHNALVRMTCLFLLFLFVQSSDDYVKYAIINVMSTAGCILNFYSIRKEGMHFVFTSLDITRHLKLIFVLLCSAVTIELYTLLDVSMLSWFCSERHVGYYTTSMKIVKMVIIVITGVSGVLLPRLSRYYKNGEIQQCTYIVNHMMNTLLFLLLPCGIGLCMTADGIMPVLFGDTFNPAIKTLQIATLLILTLGFSNLFGTQILLTFGEEKKLLMCTACGAVSNIIMNRVLIPLYAQDGAAIASVISEGIVTILTFVFSTKYIIYKMNIRGLVDTLVSGLIMGLFILFVKQYIKTKSICLLISVGGGAVVFLCASVVIKNPLLKLLRIR